MYQPSPGLMTLTDVTIESQKGGESLNTTHLIVFQKIHDNSVPVTGNVPVEKSTTL